MTDTLTCFQCQRVIRPSKPLPAGTRVKCPGCATVLTIPGVMGQDMVGFRSAAAAAPPPPPAPLPADLPDDEPAPRRRRSYDRDEDRPVRRERVRRDDFDDDDDRPRRRRDADDDRPRSIRKKSSGSNKGLVLGLSIGGGVLGVILIGLVLFLTLRGGGSADGLVGRWETNQMGMRVRLEFSSDGRLVQDLGLIRINQTYRIVDADTIEVKTDPLAAMDIKFPGGMPGGRPGGFPAPHITERMDFRVNGNTLIIIDRGMTKRFQRI